MFQILKTRQNFTLRWLLDLRNNSLWQNLRQSTLDYLFFIPAIFYLLFRCSVAIIEGAVSLTWCWLLHLGYGFLVARRLGVIGSLLLNECLPGFDHGEITTYSVTPNCRKYSSQTCTQFSQNVGMPPMPKTVIAWYCSGL